MHSRLRFVRLLILMAAVFGLVQLSARSAATAPTPAVDGDAALYVGGQPVNLPAAQVNNPEMACPLNSPPYVAGMEIVERTDFCIYYQEGTSSDYDNGILSPADAELAADIVQDYWDRYVNDFGFLEPAHTDKLEVLLEAGSHANDCNGATGPSLNYMYTYTQCYKTPESIQKVLGHELFHRVQYAYDGVEVKWFKEGTARAMEDNAFDNIDNWATTLTAISSSFNKQVNTYLGGTTANNDITSNDMRYHSALWWKYYTEQYGSTPGEPGLGVDAFLTLWQAAATQDDVSALNSALNSLAGTNFSTAFRRFAVANWTKDLTGVPDASYNYVDEDQVGNGAPYGPLTPINGGTINSGSSATWNNQNVARYGAAYFQATPGANCPVVTATFHRDSGSGEFYHVVTQKGNALQTVVEGSGTDWTQSFLNNDLTKVVAIVGSTGTAVSVDITLSCADPVINIEQPNQGAPAYVGVSNAPDDIVVQVSVTNGSPAGPVVGGLTNSDFSVEVGGVPALVVGGGFVQEEYFLLVDTPAQSNNGPYDLEVFLEEPGTPNVIASDLEPEAVVYDATNTDHVIITDVSGSMAWDGKMPAAQNAAHLYIDASNSTDGLGLVSFATDVEDTLPIEFGTLPHREDAHDEVATYVPTWATSIGDGLNEAVNLLNASPTGNTRCQFTLLSDGMENQPLYWADVETAVVDTGCPVMTVAFGQASNEMLMQDIATTTGGASYYNDVYVSNAEGGFDDQTELDLGDTYLHALCEGQGCKRLLREQGTASYGQVITHTFNVDSSVEDLTIVLDWGMFYIIPLEEENVGGLFHLLLQSPSGQTYGPEDYAFENGYSGHVGFKIADPEAGEWAAAVVSLNDFNNKPYQLIAAGQTPIQAVLLLPAVQELKTGDYVPIYAIWRPGGTALALVSSPDGTVTPVPLYDDGQHDDGPAGDGFFGGLYTLVNQAEAVPPVDEDGVPAPPPPQDEGAYRVLLLAQDGDIRREKLGSFAVLEGEDSNNDGVPDDFIATHCPGAPNSDADLDQLSCSDEYYTGTDPNNSDTDGGGENDGSEVLDFGTNPLNPAGDQIEAPDFLHTQAQNGSVLVTYDVKAEYVAIRLYRATNPNGPWTLRVSELPLSGSYVDTATNDTTYLYRILALDAQGHGSAIPTSTPVTPSVDPIPPAAQILIDDGAPTTSDLDVLLSFVPYEGEPDEIAESFDDITEVMISNDPFFAGATWQPFEQDIPWELPSDSDFGWVYVYARFRDEAGNESVGTAVGAIFFQQSRTFLPIMLKQP